MAQRKFAPAPDTATPQHAAEPAPPARRAAAYLDLWERQLQLAAAHGPADPARGPRKPA